MKEQEMGDPVEKHRGRMKDVSQDQAAAELEEMVLAMAKNIVDQPDRLEVVPAIGPKFIAFEVLCEPSDAGALIGRRGVHAEAMRTLLMAAGTARDVRVSVQFVSRNGQRLGSNR
jgi:predicted RNA-binding protein YlqC (UPF0109 family)